jgi:tyrosyl-tRNA synthetase
LKLFTDLPMSEIEKLASLSGAELNAAKKILAFEATKIAHGSEAAISAENASDALFSGGADSDSVPTLSVTMSNDMSALDFSMLTGLFPSKSDARRTIEQGGLIIDNKKIESVDEIISKADVIMIQKGKKTFLRVLPNLTRVAE